MDVSSYESEPSGQELIQTVVSLTELPELMIQHELEQILEIPKRNSEDVTIEQLREAMLAYLEQVDKEISAELAASIDT
jgi:hypothetical protein